MQPIVVAVDGSEAAQKAVDWTARLAAALDAPVVVVHVLREAGMGRVPTELVEYARIEHVEVTEAQMLLSAGKALADRVASQLRDELGIDPEVRVEVGDPGHEIARVADEVKAEMIVMGTRGHGDLAGLVLGSVSHKVVHLAERPVMLVR